MSNLLFSDVAPPPVCEIHSGSRWLFGPSLALCCNLALGTFWLSRRDMAGGGFVFPQLDPQSGALQCELSRTYCLPREFFPLNGSSPFIFASLLACYLFAFPLVPADLVAWKVTPLLVFRIGGGQFLRGGGGGRWEVSPLRKRWPPPTRNPQVSPRLRARPLFPSCFLVPKPLPNHASTLSDPPPKVTAAPLPSRFHPE